MSNTAMDLLSWVTARPRWTRSATGAARFLQDKTVPFAAYWRKSSRTRTTTRSSC
ncbi:MAG: hypothetical protein ACLTYN_15860 [Dysosmobacter welbionis]